MTPDMMSKYMRRDPIIEKVVSSQFAKMFQGGINPVNNNQGDESNQEGFQPNFSEVDDDDETILHYIITPETALPNTQRVPLPEVIALQWTCPKESKYVAKKYK